VMLHRRGPAGFDATEHEEQRPRRDRKGITNIGYMKPVPENRSTVSEGGNLVKARGFHCTVVIVCPFGMAS